MTQHNGFTLFDTAIGRCGIAWSGTCVTRVTFPERSDAATKARLLKKVPPDIREAPPPPAVAEAIAGIVALAAGGKPDLSNVPLDLDGVPEFNARVYDVARRIGPGETLTYGDIAVRLGDKLLARDVGQALGQNPIPILVPCHRVLAAGNRIGGFSAPGGSNTKAKLLAIEGVHVEPDRKPAPRRSARPAREQAPTLFDIAEPRR